MSRATAISRRIAGRLARSAAAAAGFELVRRGAFDLVPHDYYSPVPDLAQVPPETWTRRSALTGLDLRVDAAIELVERELSPFIAESAMRVEDPGVPGEFFLANGGFESVDAELLYAMVRFARPGRVVELGSGYSTLVISMACRRNAEEGVETLHEAYDPYPRPHILGRPPPSPTRLAPVSATDVPQEVFTSLQAGDILFVDTTHTVKLAGDVNRIVLDVLPALSPGVIVHFHDIFLPWEYPRAWVAELRRYWAEQYLLQAFLAFNDEFEVLVPAHALAREHPARLAAVIPSFGPGVAPGSLWLRRRA
ncbi:MAG TPA: class I SAM-dependent methyltransferase [Solirubrobacteraceae bacterium]|nr:class I SAM-dependent methyltransferase [Solirubrobacteraceae bacterium]